ncbi:MAG: hypothetical protein KDJ65_25335 [Anaerolineae bacterium]|nr:hypothetical protein [Anaerolineae bacterium]
MPTQKSLPFTIAIGVQVLLSLLDIAVSIPDLTGTGPAEGPPLFIVVLSLVIGILGLGAAWAAWQGQRWGVIAIIVLRAIDGLGAAPGIFFAPTTTLVVLATLGVVLSVLVIVLLLLPASRHRVA